MRAHLASRHDHRLHLAAARRVCHVVHARISLRLALDHGVPMSALVRRDGVAIHPECDRNGAMTEPCGDLGGAEHAFVEPATRREVSEIVSGHEERPAPSVRLAQHVREAVSLREHKPRRVRALGHDGEVGRARRPGGCPALVDVFVLIRTAGKHPKNPRYVRVGLCKHHCQDWLNHLADPEHSLPVRYKPHLPPVIGDLS